MLEPEISHLLVLKGLPAIDNGSISFCLEGFGHFVHFGRSRLLGPGSHSGADFFSRFACPTISFFDVPVLDSTLVFMLALGTDNCNNIIYGCVDTDEYITATATSGFCTVNFLPDFVHMVVCILWMIPVYSTKPDQTNPPVDPDAY